MASRSSRRDFLKGRPGDAAPAVPDSHREPETPGSPRTYLIHVARAAMACEFEALFNAGQYPDPSTAGVAALETIAVLEEQMSYFRATSEITRLNALAAEGPVEVEPRLFQLLELATDLFGKRRAPLTSHPRRSGRLGDSPAAREGSRTRSSWPRRGSGWAAILWSSTPKNERFASRGPAFA